MQCPGSVIEGGRVAHASGFRNNDNKWGCPPSPRVNPNTGMNNCERPDDDDADANAINTYYQCLASNTAGGSSEYCEYRDGIGRDDWPDFMPLTPPSPSREKTAYVTINATTGGQWIIFVSMNADRRLLIKQGSVRASIDPMVQAGETKTIEFKVLGRANYRKGGNGNGVILVGPPGLSNENQAIASCTVTVKDDDNMAWIGSRDSHPYGDQIWQSMPHCWDEVGCASQQ